MRFRWSARQYERTCADCGCPWQLSRQLARKRAPSIDSAKSDLQHGMAGVWMSWPSELPAARAALVEQMKSLRVCPNCGSAQYSQLLVRFLTGAEEPSERELSRVTAQDVMRPGHLRYFSRSCWLDPGSQLRESTSTLATVHRS